MTVITGVIYVILLLTELASQSKVPSIDLAWLDKAKSFDEIFAFEKEIYINLGDELIGEISDLRFSKDGNILITDRRANKVWLLTPEANLISELSIEKSNPGIKWNPYVSFFDSQGQVYVINPPLSNTLYVFDRQGHYQRKVVYDKIFPGIRDAIFDEKHLFIYRVSSSHYSICKVDLNRSGEQGEILQTFGIFPEEFRNIIGRLGDGGKVVVDANGNIYQSNVCCPEVYKFNPNLKLVDTFSRKPIHYHQFASDFPQKVSPNDPTTLRQVIENLNEATITTSLFYLSVGLLVIQYENRSINGAILDFCDTRGKYYTTSGLVSKQRIFASHENSLYSVYQPDFDKEGNLPNPVILKYTLRIK